MEIDKTAKGHFIRHVNPYREQDEIFGPPTTGDTPTRALEVLDDF